MTRPESDDAVHDGFARALGAQLRSVRVAQALSLHGVERKSAGRWKAVVVGAYERGDRAISVQRLAELADFYGVELADLLPEERRREAAAPSGVPGLTRVVVLPEQVAALRDPEAMLLRRFVEAIIRQRGHQRGDTLALRMSDLPTLALMYETTAEGITARMMRWGVLAPDSVILDGEPSALPPPRGATRPRRPRARPAGPAEPEPAHR